MFRSPYKTGIFLSCGGQLWIRALCAQNSLGPHWSHEICAGGPMQARWHTFCWTRVTAWILVTCIPMVSHWKLPCQSCPTTDLRHQSVCNLSFVSAFEGPHTVINALYTFSPRGYLTLLCPWSLLKGQGSCLPIYWVCHDFLGAPVPLPRLIIFISRVQLVWVVRELQTRPVPIPVNTETGSHKAWWSLASCLHLMLGLLSSALWCSEVTSLQTTFLPGCHTDGFLLRGIHGR